MKFEPWQIEEALESYEYVVKKTMCNDWCIVEAESQYLCIKKRQNIQVGEKEIDLLAYCVIRLRLSFYILGKILKKCLRF